MSHELKAITGIFVPSGSLITGTLASGTVTSGSVGNSAINSNNIASGAITGNLIASGAVASVDLADNSIVSGKIASGSVSWFTLGSGVVNSGNLSVNSVVSGNIASGAVGPYALSSGVVTSGIIGNGAVVSGSIASGSVGLYALGVASGTVEGTQLTLDPDTGMMIWANPSAVSTRVKNGTASIISGLAVVYISGGGGANPFVAPALANADATSLTTFGVATANIGANGEGTVVTQGILNNVNTSAFNDGDVLFLSPTVPGAVTTTKPQAPDHLVLVGYVTNASNNGTIEVAIQNGYEIDELHDVKILSGSLQSGQVLQYSSGVWWNQNFIAGPSNLGSGSVTSGAIASGQVGPNALASGVIAGLIASGTIVSGDLGVGAVNNINIASGTISNDKLANSSITIDGSSTALGGSYSSQALTTSSGLLAGTYYPSGALTIGIASGGINGQMIGTSTIENRSLMSRSITIAGSITDLGNSWAAAALTAASGLSAVTYYPSGAAVIGIASGGIVAQMMGSGSVTTNAIASGSVTANALASGAISDIVGSGSVTSGDLGVGAVNNLNVASGSLSNDKLTNNTVTIAGSSTALGGSWAAASLTAASGLSSVTYYPSGSAVIGIASGGVIAQMIGSGAVTSGAVASGQIGLNHLASGTVEGLIGSGSVGSGDLALGAVNNVNIASGTVANDKLSNSAVTIAGSSTSLGGSWSALALTTSSGLLAGTYYPSGALTIGIASGGVVAQMLGSGAVTSGAIASGQIGLNHLASGTVEGLIGSGSILSGDLAIASVNNINITSGTVANDKLANNTITIAGSSTALGGSWAAASLTAASGLSAVTYYPSGAAVIGIASGGVVSGMLGNASVLSGSIGSGQIGPNHLASGAANLLLTSGIIISGQIGNNAVNSGNISSGSIGQFHLSQLLIPKVQGPGRLSLYSGAPVVSGGYISGANKLYYNPYYGNNIALYDGVSWAEYEINTPLVLDLNVGLQSGTMYDIYMFGNSGISGSPSMSAVNWTSGGNRPPITYRNGIPVGQFSNGRYLGTIRTTTSSTTEDSKFRRFVWNYDNRISQTLYYTDSTQHTYNNATPQVWNLNSGSRLEFVQGIAGLGASASCFIASYVTPGATSVCSFESEGVFSGTNYNVYNTFTGLFWNNSTMLVGNCNEGYNFLQLMESCQSGTVTNVSMTLTGMIEG